MLQPEVISLRAHYLQHVPFEGLGSIEDWLNNSGYSVTRSPLYADSQLPKLRDVDFLIAMGGPMSVNDEAGFPWLADEKRFVREAIEAGITVLGICLGAQLIASALGARVYANPHKEIGWFDIHGVSHDDESLYRFPERLEVFHWHGETFDLPDGAKRLASSEACDNQAFQVGDAVIGLQFHLETTPDSARLLVENCRDELDGSRYVQTEQEILAHSAERCAAINQTMESVLQYMHREAGA